MKWLQGFAWRWAVNSRKILNRQEIDAALEEAYMAAADCILREDIEKVLRKPVLSILCIPVQAGSQG